MRTNKYRRTAPPSSNTDGGRLRRPRQPRVNVRERGVAPARARPRRGVRVARLSRQVARAGGIVTRLPESASQRELGLGQLEGVARVRLAKGAGAFERGE